MGSSILVSVRRRSRRLDVLEKEGGVRDSDVASLSAQIETIFEDECLAMGYFVKGHVDRTLFAAACNWQVGCKPDEREYATPDKVDQVWMRTVPQAGTHTRTIVWDNKPGPGATAVTVFEW